MANVFDALSNETLQKVADGGDLWGSMTNEELQKIAAGGYDDPIPGMDQATQSAPAQPAQPAPRQRVSSYEEAIARAQQPGQGEGGFWSGVGEAISEGAKGAGRAVKEGVGGLVVNTVSGLTRLAGTPVRALTGWEGLHKLANAIDESYANFGAQALESEYGANPDGFGYGAGRFGEKLTGIAGNLGGLAAPGGIAKAAKAPAVIKTAAAAVQKSFPYMFGNNAAVQAYDTARENGKSKAEATALAGLNGAIHFLGFKAFENQSLNKMLGMPKSMEAMMPKWANEAMAESAPKTFTELARSVRNGMIKHTLAERGRGMLKAGGIMALQDMLSDIPMQVAEGGSWDNIDFNRVGKKGLEGLEEGALMEGAMGAAAMLRSNKSARNFLADKIYRNGYDVVSPSGKVYHEPGLLQTPQQRMALMKQNPDATERVLDIIEHGGVARPDELDAAFLPPDMSEKEQRKFAADWRKDLEPYVEEAWNADQSRGAGNEYFADREMSEANDAEGERRLLTAGEEKFQRQKNENDEQEAWNARMLANEERKAKAGQDEYEQMMLEHEEARARQQPEEESRSGGEQPPPEQETPKQETPDETGNGADEASARPEQGQVERPEPAAPVREEPRPVEGEPPRAEAPREEVVEPPVSTSEKISPTATEKPAETAEPVKEAPQADASLTTPAQPSENGPTTALKPTEAQTPAEPAKPEEAVSAAPAEPPVPAERPVAEETPAPREETPVAEPEEKAAPAPTNRLKRADGTDPLAEKEAEAEAEKAEAKPGAMTAKQKAFRLNAMQKILGRIDPDVAIDPKALRRSQNNPNGFVLKDLKKLDDPANDGWQYELGLSKERADELRKAVHDAYEEQLAASPNRKDKTNETGQDTYSVSASRALERLARNPKSIKQMGIAHEQVLAAMTSAKERGDEQGAKFWEDRVSALNDQIGKLSPSDQNKVLKSIRDTQSMKSAMERKDTQSLESGEGKTLDVAAEDGQIGRAIDEEAVAQTNSIRGGGGKGGALSGNRHLRIDKVDGDELTVTLMDAAGKPRGTAQKMNRTQWEMLGKAAAINDGIDGDPSNPQKGDMLRMSRNGESPAERDLRFASDENYQKWLKDRKANDVEPLRERYEQEQAKAAKSIARNALPGVDVEIVDRAFNPETDGGVGERKSIGGIFTGTAADYANRSRQGGVDDGPSLKKIGTGEGAQVYGWGLYGSNQRGVAEGYANRGKYYKLKFDGEDIDQDGGTITAAQALYESGMDYDKAVGNLKKQLAVKRHGMSVESVAISDAIEILESSKGRLSVEAPSKSYVYEQTFFTDRAPGDESHLLSWYEPLGAEKAKTIVDGAKSLLMLHHIVDAETAKRGMAEKTVSKWTGKDLYKKMASVFGEEGASRMLRSMGIDGIKYPADSFGKSIKNGDRTGWDYVSFRDDNIRVDHKWEDGQTRYLRDGEGRVVGTFDRSTNKVTLYRGASAATLVHELGGHATLRFAEQEAERGNRQLLDRINRTIDEAPQALKDEIRSRYPGVDETALRDEIWAALRERNSPAMEKAIKTLQGKAWYNRAWSAFRDAWKGLLARMGFNRADLSQIDRMSNDEFLSHLDRIMSDGKTLGRLEAMGEGTRANPIAESQESVREARSPRPAGSRIMDDQQTKGEKFTEKFLDRLAPAQSVQDEIGGVEEIVGKDGYTDHRRSTDFVAAADKANGREEALTRNLQKKVDQVENDISQAALKGQDTAELLADFDLYAQCKHAAERNRTIAERNGVEYDADYYYGMGKVDRGGERVGLSENVANEIVRELREKYGDKLSHFEDAQKKLVEINREDIRNRVASGRLSAQDANQYLYRWQDYVPLKTDMAKLEPDGFNSSTASMRRNEFMKARGRGNADIADSPFAASVLQAEQGIRGSVKNELLNVAANLVEHAADKGNAIGEIVRGETLPKGAGWTFTLSDGTKVTAGGSMRLAENRPDVLLFKRNGELMAIRIDKGANGRGLALSKAISGENIGRWGSGTEWIPRMTHWMSAMRTQYSPEFIVSNLLADHLEAYQALVGRYGIKGGTKTFAKMVASEIGNFKALRNYLKTGMMTRDVGEAVRAGLLTKGGVASEGFDGKEQSIRSHIEDFRRKQKKWQEMSAADWAKNGWSNIRDFISFANEMAEYSTRMGIFSALKKQGVPVKDAVKFARDATVNFNRKGTAMPLINGLYMFANASVQGTVRSVQAMRDEHGKELVGLLVGIGVAKAVLDNVLGDDEEREKSGGRSARNLSDYDRKHNVGVPIPGTNMQFAPLRFRGPYAAVPYIAQMATNVALGNQTPEQGAVKLVKELGEQVTDIVGGNGVVNDRGEIDGSLLMQSVAPSVADPIIQLASGKDYKGDERRAKEFDKTTPASSNGKRNTPLVYKMLAQGINAIPVLSGGNENRKGRLDFAPEDIQLIVEFLGAGPARDIGNAVSTVQNVAELAKGGSPERTLSQVPFVRRVVKEYPENTTRYYNAIDSYERDKAEFNRTTDLKRRAEFGRAHPQVRPMVVDGKVQSKSRVDALNDRVKELMHLERGEIKNGRKWVERKTPITETQKKSYHDRRLELQAKVLDILGA